MSDFRIILSTKADGNLSFLHGDRAEVESNRAAFYAAHGINARDIAFIEPRHTGSVAVVGRKGKAKVEGETISVLEPFLKAPAIDADFPDYLTAFDGLVTFDPTASVALLSADCVPLVVIDEVTGLHGILHVGLLGLLNDITGAFAEILRSHSIPADRIKFYFGPHISASDYDLSKSGMWKRVGTQALERCPWLDQFISRRDGGQFLDLAGALKFRLVHIGALSGNMTFDSRSTAEEGSEFFSHYLAKRNGVPNGRFMTVVGK